MRAENFKLLSYLILKKCWMDWRLSVLRRRYIWHLCLLFIRRTHLHQRFSVSSLLTLYFWFRICIFYVRSLNCVIINLLKIKFIIFNVCLLSLTISTIVFNNFLIDNDRFSLISFVWITITIISFNTFNYRIYFSNCLF